MEFVPTFFLSVLGVAEELHHNPARMRLIVRRSYAHLENRLRRAFEGRADVEVIADRRWRERRVAARAVEGERRRAERRARKEEILEIVIEGDPLSMFPTASRS
jgi:hypothetical protein